VLLDIAGASSDSVLLFSRPGALATIVITKEVRSDNDLSIDVDRLVLELEYDFTQRSGRTRDLDVEVNDDLLPLITVSRRDDGGRTDGRGRFRRSFATAEPVTLEAPATHGVWTFQHWETDVLGEGAGAGLVKSREIEVVPSSDTEVRAVYSLSTTTPEGAVFRRGDSNGDGRVDISDPVSIVAFLFLGGSPSLCADAADANDDGKIDISDPVGILGFLFLGTDAPQVPGPDTCGEDPTADELATCEYPIDMCP